MRKPLLIVVMAMFLVTLSSPTLFSAIKVGEVVPETYASPHPYRGGGGVVWEQVFHWPEAGYISLHFSNFELAPGDVVEVSSPDGQFSYTYNGKGKSVRGGQEVISEFWATHIPGDMTIVRLRSRNPNGGWGFEIDKWVRGFEPMVIQGAFDDMEGITDVDIEAICGSDDMEWAQCYSGTTMYDKAKAVCRLLMNGSSACTGWLLGSEGHVMTNNHCIGNQTTANNTDYEFMAEGSCSTNCSGWLACPGTVEATSGTLVQTDSALDYTLVLLPTNLTSTYGYLQMRDTLPVVNERIYIPQHASAWGKQLAVYSTHSSDQSGFGEIYTTSTTPCTGGPGDIGYYADTAGGSSGSPVIAYDDHLVVSLHHCANCPNRGVPIPAIITDLGSNLPNDALGTSTPSAPAAPSNLKAKGGKAKVTLTWNDNSGNEDGFKVFRSNDGVNFSLIITLGANTTSYLDSGLPRKATFYYKVCAYNTIGENCSGVVSGTTK
jgi:hypothetical protein